MYDIAEVPGLGGPSFVIFGQCGRHAAATRGNALSIPSYKATLRELRQRNVIVEARVDMVEGGTYARYFQGEAFDGQAHGVMSKRLSLDRPT